LDNQPYTVKVGGYLRPFNCRELLNLSDLCLVCSFLPAWQHRDEPLRRSTSNGVPQLLSSRTTISFGRCNQVQGYAFVSLYSEFIPF